MCPLSKLPRANYLSNSHTRLLPAVMSEEGSEFVPLRKKLRRVETGEEYNFVPAYLPTSLSPATSDTRQSFEKASLHHNSLCRRHCH